jgi:predicted transglutaminase-like cysteine proteinase
MNRGFLIVTIAVFMLLGGSLGWCDFQPWSERVFEYVAQEYGADAEKRLRFLHDMIRDSQDLSDMEKVVLVNKTLNRLPWISDATQWQKADYWAAPIETIATFGGDCEDIAIVKWVMLVHLGITKERLRLAYVKIRQTGENHMVLLFVKNPTAALEELEVYVLDNYVEEVKRGYERTDLLAVYITDVDGNIVLLEDKDGIRSIKGVYEERKIRKLEELKARIAENREKLRELNDGIPILP